MAQKQNVQFFLTESTSFTIVTGGGAWVFSKETGKLIRFVPEHPIIEKQSDALSAATTLLVNLEGVQGVEELRVHLGKLLVSLAEKVASEVKAKAA